PSEFKARQEEYVAMVCQEMIPAVAKQGIAKYCDVFCEQGVFTVSQSRQILKNARENGMAGKIHADELEPSGGSLLGAELGCCSAEHLLEVTPEGISALARAGVIGVLLPATSFYLTKGRYAPAREMLNQGVPLALATDCNPGSAPTESMQLVLTLACLYLKLTPAESIVAATINSAHAVGAAHKVGSLELGKQADILIMGVPNYNYLAYHFGGNHLDMVIKRGRVVHRRE
ncbi:MAG TPA: amidohydrolase family protein, partial [Verrucomicrobiae bacterium]|nr:amidohydrolase family protein [Verrucomicrobiae bacterium]